MVRQGSDLSATLAELHRRWWRDWLVWAAVYVAGFVLLWAVGQAHGWPFYAWAIGWAIAKGLWDERCYWSALKRRMTLDGPER